MYDIIIDIGWELLNPYNTVVRVYFEQFYHTVVNNAVGTLYPWTNPSTSSFNQSLWHAIRLSLNVEPVYVMMVSMYRFTKKNLVQEVS